MFRDASGKFYALAAKGEDRINLSQLLAAEMRFNDFYLEFKHEITKKMQLDNDVPDIKGDMAELSLVFWRLIRFAMTTALASEQKDFILITQRDHDDIVVLIKYSGEAIPDDVGTIINNYLQGNAADLVVARMDKGFLLAMMILKKYSARARFFMEDGLNAMSIMIPYHVSTE